LIVKFKFILYETGPDPAPLLPLVGPMDLLIHAAVGLRTLGRRAFASVLAIGLAGLVVIDVGSPVSSSILTSAAVALVAALVWRGHARLSGPRARGAQTDAELG